MDNLYKEAPAALKETPAIGSFLSYNGSSWKVEKIVYDFVFERIYIELTIII